MADTIVDGTQFNAQLIQYAPPKANASGGKSINITYPATKSGVRISTPLMLTWGASEYEGNGRFEMALQFPSGEYATEDCSAFLKNMQEFEEKIKADALTYSKDWFGKTHSSPDVIEALFTPMLKYGKDKFTGNPDTTRAPTLRVKLTIWEGVWKCLVCDEDGEKLFPGAAGVTPLDFLKKGTNVAVIMQCGGLWFANGKFGVTWKLAQAVVQRPKPSLLDECLIKLKPSDKAKLKSQPPVDLDEDDAVVNTTVADSDEEEGDEEVAPAPQVQVEVPAVVPPVAVAVAEEPKKVVKKVVKKKVAGEA
uniref:Uncharacterized protein n=1 Tax=viral metagenome TaxID=1070528 RepID=A0A6C0AZL8_9ZZZZ